MLNPSLFIRPACQFAGACLIAGTIAASSVAPASAATSLTTTEKAAIRCVAAGTVIGVITFFTTFSPTATGWAATAACVMAGGEEAIASELEK